MQTENNECPAAGANGIVTTPIGEFEENGYLDLLSDIDLSDQQKREFLQTIWAIMKMFVELDMPSENWGQILESITENQCCDSVEVISVEQTEERSSERK